VIDDHRRHGPAESQDAPAHAQTEWAQSSNVEVCIGLQAQPMGRTALLHCANEGGISYGLLRQKLAPELSGADEATMEEISAYRDPEGRVRRLLTALQ